jgi:AraC-like DNA-binding protein
MSEHIFDLSILALGARGDAHEAALRRGWRAAKSRDVLREIDAGLADPRLSLATVAERLGLAEPEVRALYDEIGEAFSERLEARRLDFAMRLLRSPDSDRLSIAEVAALAGFADVGRFRRRFRARFGDTPGAARTRLPN